MIEAAEQEMDRAMSHARLLRSGISLAALMAMGPAAHALTVDTTHVTDGVFTSSVEWAGRPTISKQIFPQGSDGSGGAALYVEQGTALGNNKLYLMYDYFNPSDGRFLNPNANVSFSVFFQVPRDNEDYLVEITTGGITGVFTKPTSEPSTVNPDGTLNSGAPWTPASTADQASGKFLGKVGFGTSPDDSLSAHPMAEFELTFDQTAFDTPPPNPQPGLYDPAPAFWAAGASGSFPNTGAALFDPPISSAIFQLNPDGTTIVTPVLDPNSGGPVPQGNVPPRGVPEPASLVLLGAGLAALAGLRRRPA
jgi:hypothetical protein